MTISQLQHHALGEAGRRALEALQTQSAHIQHLLAEFHAQRLPSATLLERLHVLTAKPLDGLHDAAIELAREDEHFRSTARRNARERAYRLRLQPEAAQAPRPAPTLQPAQAPSLSIIEAERMLIERGLSPTLPDDERGYAKPAASTPSLPAEPTTADIQALSDELDAREATRGSPFDD